MRLAMLVADNIQENAIAAYLLAKATIILEFESIISKELKADEAKFPKWLQILAPAAQSAGDTDTSTKETMWAGKVSASKLQKDDLKRLVFGTLMDGADTFVCKVFATYSSFVPNAANTRL